MNSKLYNKAMSSKATMKDRIAFSKEMLEQIPPAIEEAKTKGWTDTETLLSIVADYKNQLEENHIARIDDHISLYANMLVHAYFKPQMDDVIVEQVMNKFLNNSARNEKLIKYMALYSYYVTLIYKKHEISKFTTQIMLYSQLVATLVTKKIHCLEELPNIANAAIELIYGVGLDPFLEMTQQETDYIIDAIILKSLEAGKKMQANK